MKGEAQKSQETFKFTEVDAVGPRFLQTRLVNPLVFTMHLVCTLLMDDRGTGQWK